MTLRARRCVLALLLLLALVRPAFASDASLTGTEGHPRSTMCCVHGSVDFNDPVQRQAYIEARQNPDLRSVRSQLEAHYRRYWR